MSERLLTDSILLAFGIELILARKISKLQLLVLFMRFVEAHMIVLNGGNSMLKGTRTRHKISMKLDNLLLGKFVSLIKLFEENSIRLSCATTADVFLMRY